MSGMFLQIFRETKVMSTIRNICISAAQCRDVVDRKEMLKSHPASDEGTAGERSVNLDSLIQGKVDIFPTTETMNKLFNGIAFKKLPIINIRVSKNNSIFTLTDSKGTPKLTRSCGIEGFRNTRKGTNIAAQSTAISFGTHALEKGIKTVRTRVRGLGPGRTAAIKGLQMSGLNIVSVTDATRVSWTPPRPKKQRKL
nr:RPS11 [Pagiophloeus tsushimanus]